LAATLQSYAGPLTGSITFLEGSRTLRSVALHGGSAGLTLPAPAPGVHFYSAIYRAHGIALLTPRIAVTVGRAIPTLTVSNQKLTVVGGRTAACDQEAATRGAF
jgi:hypothetical protein